jgi:very-short-patch-repair endonuclease
MDDHRQHPSLDAAASALAARQHALLAVRQLRELGFSQDMVRTRIVTGRYERVRRGVVAIAGVPPSYEQAVLSAVLAAGLTAAASHFTATKLRALPTPDHDRIEITTVLERQPRLPGVWAHRSGLLVDNDRTEVGGIPVHSVERTIADLSGRLTPTELATLLDESLRRRLTSLRRLWWVHGRLPLAPGRNPSRLESLLCSRTPEYELLESELEERVYEAIRAAGLPLPVPQHQIVVGGRRRRLDFAYPEARVALEIDGFEWHSSRQAFDDDRLRGNEIALAGYVSLHFTSATSNDQIVAQVRRALEHPFVQKPAS